MKYFVYILFSIKCNRYYIGYSANPILRLAERHNAGKVKATKNCMPYQLIKMKEFDSELDAIQEERRIKKMKSRKYIEQLIHNEW